MDRPKSGLIMQGFMHVEEVNFHDYFSPVVNQTTIKTIIHLASIDNWLLHHVNVNNAFEHGYFYEEIHIRPPEGYKKALPS